MLWFQIIVLKIDVMLDWKRNRDQLIHALAKVPYDNERVKEIALTGQEIVRVLDNKTKSLNKYFDEKEGEKDSNCSFVFCMHVLFSCMRWRKQQSKVK